MGVATILILASAIGVRCFQGAWLGGGSWLGFPCGIIAFGICFFEFLLWPRKWKRFRVKRLGRAQVWLRAHIWLGLLSLPLVLAHVGLGFHHGGWLGFGGTLTTLLFWAFFLTIASGVWGLAMQQFLPRRLLEEVSGETIFAQIDQVSQRLSLEAEHLVLVTCGPEAGAIDSERLEALEVELGPSVLLANRPHSGATPGRPQPGEHVPGSEALRSFFRQDLKPYLEQGKAGRFALRLPAQSKREFDSLRERLPAEAHPVVETLERLCDQRRQFDRQAWLHFLLHSWLWLHVPLSILMMVLLIAHVASCWIYW